MFEALGTAYNAINKINAWDSKKRVLICLMVLLGFDPFSPLLPKGKQ